MKNYRVFSILSLVLMVMAAIAQPVEAEIIGVFTGGHYTFDYSASNGYGDTFDAEGVEFEASGTFGGSQLVACGGFYDQTLPARDKTVMTLYAAYRNPDTTVDAAVLWVTHPGDGVPAGTYPITFGQTNNMFVFLDNIEAFEPPTDWTDIPALIAWATGLQALHLFTATSGAIEITEVSADAALGTFTGSMADYSDFFFPATSVTNGSIDYEGILGPESPTSFGHVKVLYR